MKRICIVFLCIAMMITLGTVAYASGLTIMDSADWVEETSQFPFLAETDELAVNVRKKTSTKSEKVGRLERGTQVTVLAAELSSSGEVWYAVELGNGTRGYIRSDLLVASKEQQVAQLSQVLPVQEAVQRSFKAEPTQATVNVRQEASTKSGKAGQIKQGEILTVLSQMVNSVGETWYAVKLNDGTTGYIRSDLLIETDEMEVKKASYQAAGSKKTATEKTTTKTSSGNYIGNKNSKKFHRTSCHTLPKKSNQVHFSSREKAISSGYTPCKNCRP